MEYIDIILLTSIGLDLLLIIICLNLSMQISVIKDQLANSGSNVDKPKHKKSIGDLFMKMLAIDDDYLFDDEEDTDPKEKKQTDYGKLYKERTTKEIIQDIDSYALDMNLRDDLVKDIKNGKFSELDTDKLKELNQEYKEREDRIRKKREEAKRKQAFSVLNTAHGRVFISGQDMVDYIASNRMNRILDRSTNRVKGVLSFSYDKITSQLNIYWDDGSGISVFYPGIYESI